MQRCGLASDLHLDRVVTSATPVDFRGITGPATGVGDTQAATTDLGKSKAARLRHSGVRTHFRTVLQPLLPDAQPKEKQNPAEDGAGALGLPGTVTPPVEPQTQVPFDFSAAFGTDLPDSTRSEGEPGSETSPELAGCGDAPILRERAAVTARTEATALPPGASPIPEERFPSGSETWNPRSATTPEESPLAFAARLVPLDTARTADAPGSKAAGAGALLVERASPAQPPTEANAPLEVAAPASLRDSGSRLSAPPIGPEAKSAGPELRDVSSGGAAGRPNPSGRTTLPDGELPPSTSRKLSEDQIADSATSGPDARVEPARSSISAHVGALDGSLSPAPAGVGPQASEDASAAAVVPRPPVAAIRRAEPAVPYGLGPNQKAVDGVALATSASVYAGAEPSGNGASAHADTPDRHLPPSPAAAGAQTPDIASASAVALRPPVPASSDTGPAAPCRPGPNQKATDGLALEASASRYASVEPAGNGISAHADTLDARLPPLQPGVGVLASEYGKAAEISRPAPVTGARDAASATPFGQWPDRRTADEVAPERHAWMAPEDKRRSPGERSTPSADCSSPDARSAAAETLLPSSGAAEPAPTGLAYATGNVTFPAAEQPAAKETRTAPAPSLPPEPAPQPAAGKSPVRDIKLGLERGSERVEVRLVDRGGEIHVAVRTPNQRLTHELRRELAALAERLESCGFEGEASRAGSVPRSEPVRLAARNAEYSPLGQPAPREDGGGRRRNQNESEKSTKKPRKDFACFMSSLA